jgi:mono/diheme cytochrome c family protein
LVVTPSLRGSNAVARTVLSIGMVMVTLAGVLLAADDDKAGESKARQEAFFESRVRPILAEHCWKCHGERVQKAGLRLDSASALRRGSDNGEIVVPGAPDASLLIEAVRHSGATKMPPKSKLPNEAVADLERWVRAGAHWPESTAVAARPVPAEKHWAFQPIHDYALPAVRNSAWAQSPIDRFVLDRLESNGLEPSPSSDKRTLIRRATFDLIGLPPTPEEVDAFLSDQTPGAFARVVDRLLASPHYGERWGRHWLDVARYADTKGYVFFQDANFPWAYTYRDYVIRSLNEDTPFDRFIVEQLAADRLPLGEDRRPLAALGFVTLGGRFMNNVHDVIDDRIDVVSRGLMALTVSCARCHDHKFDPIPTRDYYALYGVFASTVEPNVPPLFEPPPQTEAYAKFETELKIREHKLNAFVVGKHRELVESVRRRAAEYLLAAHKMRDKPSTEDFMLIADGGDLNPTMLVRWQRLLDRTRRTRDPALVPWHELSVLPEADFADRAKSVIASWSASPGDSQTRNAWITQALVEEAPKTLGDLARIYGQALNAAECLSQDWRTRAALEGQPARPSPISGIDDLWHVFHGADAPPDVPVPPAGDLALLPDRASQGQLQELLKAVETWRATGPGAPARAMALEDASVPMEPRVFLRGNPNNLGEPVPRRFLSALSKPGAPSFQDGGGRLDLAHAIASRDNPLTARVIVNRVWLNHFGSPLVATPSDFGIRSDPPSHPELLDHLATTFMDEGWSLKRLHRRILLSATYQQTSDDRFDGRRIDPENRLLWRMNRARLDFETTRDALLAVSGRMDRQVGGPPQKEIVASAATRRTLYGFIDRLNVPGLYRTFDFPDPNATSPRREQTTIAPQALFLLNHPFVIECSRMVLNRPKIAQTTDRSERISRIHRLLFSRAPGQDERRMADRFLESATPADRRWQDYVHSLLLSNEFVFID